MKINYFFIHKIYFIPNVGHSPSNFPIIQNCVEDAHHKLHKKFYSSLFCEYYSSEKSILLTD